jgi:hypothetical protein
MRGIFPKLDESARQVHLLHPVAGAFLTPEQLTRNTVYSGTRRSKAAYGRRPGRSGPLAYRFALPQATGLSAQLAGSQVEDEFLLRALGTAPRVDGLNGMAKPFSLRAASAPAVHSLA